MKIKYRKADFNDLDGVFEIFKNAIDNMNSNKIFQWDEIYPDRKTLYDDILKQQLYIGTTENKTAVAFVLNCDCDTEYENGKWQYTDCSFFILHRLCVNPEFQNQGVGTATVEHIESTARNLGAEAIRLDAFSENPYALSMYKKLNYKTVGYADFRKGRFLLMEKKL